MLTRIIVPGGSPGVVAGQGSPGTAAIRVQRAAWFFGIPISSRVFTESSTMTP
jgi:hypothetical protein